MFCLKEFSYRKCVAQILFGSRYYKKGWPAQAAQSEFDLVFGKKIHQIERDQGRVFKVHEWAAAAFRKNILCYFIGNLIRIFSFIFEYF